MKNSKIPVEAGCKDSRTISVCRHRIHGDGIVHIETAQRLCAVAACQRYEAAGKIHTDFEKGFIRAEVVGFNDLMECGSMAAAKEKGLVRLEGKEYVMQDGDIVLFRFNV